MTHGCNIDALFKCEETNATLLQTTNIQTWCSCTHKRDVRAHEAQDRKHYLRFLYHNQNTQHYNNIKTPPTQETWPKRL